MSIPIGSAFKGYGGLLTAAVWTSQGLLDTL